MKKYCIEGFADIKFQGALARLEKKAASAEQNESKKGDEDGGVTVTEVDH